jgi:hypothetical protein
MSILSDFEDRLAEAVEGLFAGAFRSPVQPAEVAKALGKSMDDGRVVGVGRIYAPTSYTVALSPEDADKLGAFTPVLGKELATYLADHARKRGYHMTSSPEVHFIIHDALKLGRFRVGAELAHADELGAKSKPRPERKPGERRNSGPNTGPTPRGRLIMPGDAVPPIQIDLVDEDEDLVEGSKPMRGLATLTITDTHHDVALRGDRAIIGRLADSDVVLADSNISRHHSELRRVDGAWHIEDLGSTNGTVVNGKHVAAAVLRDGDVITLGASRLVFHEPRD